MDVTLGLLSSLTKTKPIERVLAPIASQVSLLIILNEKLGEGDRQQGEETPPLQEVKKCAQAVLKAADNMVAVAREQQQKQPSDGVYQQQLKSACELLDLASANFYIAAQNTQPGSSGTASRKKVEQAAKDILQAILKLLLVADDAEVRKLVRMVELVGERVQATHSLTSPQSLIPYLKNFTDAVMLLTAHLMRRQKDLIHAPTRENLITSLSVLRKSVPSLNVALQTFLKYPNNPQAQMCRDSLVGQIQSALSDIKQALTSSQPETSFFDADTPGYFIAKIDQILNALSEDHRLEPPVDLEVWVMVVVRHSMAVAHLCPESEPHRQLVVDNCQRILQVKTRVLELQQLLREGSSLPEVRDDFDGTCEDLIDECCHLEKHVNMALLHLVVDVFKETSQPLERLVHAAAKPGEESEQLAAAESTHLMAEFSDHADRMCQIATLAAASSTDNKRVRTIRAAVRRLEQLDPEILPAAVALARDPANMAAVQYLRLLVADWNNELSGLVKVMDEMTDPNVFLQVTEKRLSWDACLVREACLSRSLPGLSQALQSLLGRSRRAAQVTLSIVDNSSDAVYRNGLLVFLRQLEKAIEDVVEAGREVKEAPAGNSVAVDTLTRRLGMLQDAVRDARRGLSPAHHPSILEPRRRSVRQPPLPADTGDQLLPQRLQPKPPRAGPLADEAGVEDLLAKTAAVSVSSGIRVPSPLKVGGQSTGQQPLSGSLVHSQASAFASPEGPSQKSHIRLLHKQYLSAVMTSDKVKVNSLTSDILGWTNHIVDISHALNKHCPELERGSELLALCGEADELAPRLVDKARYVAAGDLEEVDALHVTAQSWADKLDKARVLVDVAVDKWKLLTDRVITAVLRSNKDVLRIELDCITEHQTAMSGLLERVASLAKCPTLPAAEEERAAYLCEQSNELENLTITLRTIADLLGHSEEEALYQVQLDQLCRDWCSLMCCLHQELELLTQALADLGSQRVAGLREATDEGPERLHALLSAETDAANNLLKCIVVSDEELQSVCSQLREELSELLSELRQLTLLKSGPAVWTSAMYSPCRRQLILAEWILKFLWVQQLVTDQTASFSASLDSLQAAAATIAPQKEGGSGDWAFQAEVKQLSDRMAGLRQRALLGIQLSPDLGKRATVRRCLDDLTVLTPQIISAVRDMAEGGASESGDWKMMQLRQQWAATLQKLFSTLDSMPDLRPSLVPGLKKLVGVTSSRDGEQKPKEKTENSEASRPATHSEAELSPDRSLQANTSASGTSPSFSRSPKHRPIASVLEAASYLERSLEAWHQPDNAVVQTALKLSSTVRSMTQFCHGQQSALSREEMGQAAMTAVECGRKLDKFAHTLADHCLDQGLAQDLLLAANQVSTFSSQLKIISGVLQSCTSSPNADRILLRNTTNILQATSRLLEAAETAAVKGLASPSPEAEEAEGEDGVVSLVRSWQGALQCQRRQELEALPRDSLGLRRVERHHPPQLADILRGVDGVSLAS